MGDEARAAPLDHGKQRTTVQTHTRAVLRIVLPYALFAGLWILLSDRVLELMNLDLDTRTLLSIVKGWAFVLVTALLLWILLRKEFRARAEDHAATQAAERRLADIIEFLPDATIVIDRSKRVVAWNRACEALTGVAKEEILGKGDGAYSVPFFGEPRPMLLDLLDTPDPDLETTYEYVIRGQDRIFAEAVLPRVNRGRGGHLWAVAGPLWDRRGRRSGTIEVIRDVTEQRGHERSLAESEQKYRELVELANSIILRWNADGIVTFLNEFGQRFFGYSASEIVGRHVVGTIVPPSETGGRDLNELMEQLGADPAAFEKNVNENMLRDGTRVWISWTNTVVLDEAGQVSEILSVGTDITEQRRAQDEIHALHQALTLHANELEQRVEHRTAELAVAKERAEESDRLKSAFLATMSHELRTPLNSILGFTGIILQGLAGPLTPEQEKQLNMVRGSARHLLALINDVLDISKIEAGQLKVTGEPFDVRSSIGKVVELVRPLAAEKGLNLRETIDPSIGTLVSDSRRVEQILLNLLNNAVKFTAEGEVCLDAAVERGRLRVSVQDTGIGIEPEDLGRLFQPFHQVETGLTRAHEGTGLGLAISRRLAGLLGGEVRAESRWGQGSTFSLFLPLVEGGPA